MEKRKKFIIAIVVVALFLSSIIVVRLPAPLGSIIVPDDYSSIQAAVDHAFAGQTIFVRNGVYHEQHITIDKSVSLIGEDSKNTILEGINNVKYPPQYVIQISADNVKVSGFTITNGYQAGIRVETIGSDIQPTGCIITGNNIMNNAAGISTYDGKDLTISNNNISNNRESGIFESSSYSIISENIISQNGGAAITVDSCNNVTISNNKIIDNENGVYLRWNGNFNVYANNITNNEGYGVQFGEGYSNSIVHDNNINGNHVGVNLFNFALTNDSDIGIGIDNKVYENNFDNSQNVFIEAAFQNGVGNISNIFYVIGNGTDIVSWDNGKVGNFWSDYQSKYPNASQVDASGIGNTPYVIDENNTDHYPLMQQVEVSTAVPASTLDAGIPLLTIAAVTAVSVVVIAIGILVYFKKRKRSLVAA